jgi:hypothetical protein
VVDEVTRSYYGDSKEKSPQKCFAYTNTRLFKSTSRDFIDESSKFKKQLNISYARRLNNFERENDVEQTPDALKANRTFSQGAKSTTQLTLQKNILGRLQKAASPNDRSYWARKNKTEGPQLYVASSSSEDENDDLNDRVPISFNNSLNVSVKKVEARAAPPSKPLSASSRASDLQAQLESRLTQIKEQAGMVKDLEKMMDANPNQDEELAKLNEQFEQEIEKIKQIESQLDDFASEKT